MLNVCLNVVSTSICGSFSWILAQLLAQVHDFLFLFWDGSSSTDDSPTELLISSGTHTTEEILGTLRPSTRRASQSFLFRVWNVSLHCLHLTCFSAFSLWNFPAFFLNQLENLKNENLNRQSMEVKFISRSAKHTFQAQPFLLLRLAQM